MGWRPLLRLLSCIVYALITRNITWQRVSPEPLVPAQMNDSLSMEEGGSEANDGSTSDQGGRGVVDELDDGLARLNDLDLTWGFDLDAFLEERAQQAPAAGDAGDGTDETMGSSRGGAVNASSAPVGRVETAETMGSSQGGAVDASSVPAGRAESDPGEAPASDTDQGNGEDPPAVLSGRAAHELSSWGWLPATVRGRTRAQSQRLEGEPAGGQLRMRPEVADALLAAAYEWTMSRRTLLKSTSWTTEDALALMAGGPAEDKKGELSARMPSGFPEHVEPPPQSVADVERSQYRAAWQEAMKIELDGHKTTGTYEAATPPQGRKPVGAKWVFTYKTDKDGLIVKTKARLVAKGFSQVQDVDYFQTFAPTPSSASVKILAAVANEHGLKIFHLDVAQAFVRAKLDTEIYMKLPGGCGDMSGKIVRLNRSLYGLKQSGRQWAGLLVETVVEYGMEQCRTDPCVFRMVVDGKVQLIMAVHVDDIVIAGSDESCRDFHAALVTKFPTNNLGELTWYTGCAFKRDWELGTLEITQKAFIESMLNRFGVNSSSDIPATPGVELGPREEGEPGGDWPYREAVGSLMWLSTMTRPDISNAVRAVARHSHNPTERHWKAVLKIMEYLHGTRFLGLTFVRGSGLDLNAYSDADYADKANDRRSVSGTVITLGGAAVSWASSTQRCVTLSTAEAEYVALGEGVKEALFTGAVLSFICPELSGSCVRVFEDNQGAIALAQNPLSSARSKHIDVRFHFVRELLRAKKIDIQFVASKDQHADILTKSLAATPFKSHRRFLLNLPLEGE